MLELPEALHLAAQLNQNVAGRRVKQVCPPTKRQKFCWYLGEPESYHKLLQGAAIQGAEGFGSYAELQFDNGMKLCVNDGVRVRLISAEALPTAYQLAVLLEDGQALVFTLAMYGGIYLHDGGLDNPYYLASRQGVPLLGPDFPAHFAACLLMQSCTQSKSWQA